MKITQVHIRYFVETEAGRLHVLNLKSLKWNLKHIFKLNKEQISNVLTQLDFQGWAEIKLAA